MKYSLPTIAILIAIITDKGEALNCYTCNSVTNSGCGSDFTLSTSAAAACQSIFEPAVCYKLKYSIGGTSIINRGCFRESTDMCDKLLEIVNGQGATCDTCKGDACNSSSVAVFSTTMMFAFITALLKA